MGTLTISMAIFYSYVELSEGMWKWEYGISLVGIYWKKIGKDLIGLYCI